MSEFTGIYSILPEFTWVHWGSLCLTLFHLDSLFFVKKEKRIKKHIYLKKKVTASNTSLTKLMGEKTYVGDFVGETKMIGQGIWLKNNS